NTVTVFSHKTAVCSVPSSCSSPPDEGRAVQRRTFTRWMNAFLQRRDPPVKVYDLFTDIQDGRILLALLEELSGCKLLYRFRSSSHRIFRLNNISKALAFLDDRHVSMFLPGIDASGIADGIPSAVLNLVWNMILYFQASLPPSSIYPNVSMYYFPSLPWESNQDSAAMGPTMHIKVSLKKSQPKESTKTLQTRVYTSTTTMRETQCAELKFGVEVCDFGRSWRSGLAFLAMIKSINPDLVDLRENLTRQPRENIQLAFTIAHHSLDIPPLLELEDVSGPSPDEQSIITYVSMFLGQCSGTDEVSSALSSLTLLLFELGDKIDSTLTSVVRVPAVHSYRSRSILQPPSPLDAGGVSQEIRSWIENASADQGDSKPTADESHLSLSSEEGIYSLSALDSDEEDAYSYILDLNEEDFQPYNQLKRQVARVEEETEKDMFSRGEQIEESIHLEVCKKTFNGSEHQEDSAQHGEPEVRAQSGVDRTFKWDKSESFSREMAHNAAVFDTESEEDSRSREERGDGSVVPGQSNDEGDHCEKEMIKEMTEYARLVKHGCDERAALMGETKNPALFDVDSCKIEVEKETEQCGHGIEDNKKEEENVPKFEEGQGRKSGKEQEEEDKDEERETQQSVVNLERFKVGVNEIMITDETACEVRDATRTNTKEGNDGETNGMDMEVLTSEDDKEECSDEVMNSEVRAAEQKDGNLKIRRRELTGETATIAGKTAPKNGTNGGVNGHGVELGWTPPRPATSQSFR
uniref:Zgc:100997 n=1 Tax=Cyclopterus lumpus TaxID=8103 RepID=A0A8C2WXE1_CYCLU